MILFCFSCCFHVVFSVFFSFLFLFFPLFLAQEELAHCLVSSLWSVMVDVLGWLSVDTYGPWLVNFYRQKLRLGAASSAGRFFQQDPLLPSLALPRLRSTASPRTPYPVPEQPIKLIYHQYSAVALLSEWDGTTPLAWLGGNRLAIGFSVFLFTIMKTFSNILCKVVPGSEQAGRMRASISCLGICSTRYRFVICKLN